MSRVLSPEFHKKIKAGATPTTYITIATQAGVRIYAKKTLTTSFKGLGTLYGSGRKYGDGLKYGQGTNVKSREPYLKSHGTIGRALQITAQSRSKSGGVKRVQNLMFSLIDAEKILRKRFALEPILSMVVSMRMGFSDISDKDHLTLYTGVVTKVTVKETNIAVDTKEL